MNSESLPKKKAKRSDTRVRGEQCNATKGGNWSFGSLAYLRTVVNLMQYFSIFIGYLYFLFKIAVKRKLPKCRWLDSHLLCLNNYNKIKNQFTEVRSKSEIHYLNNLHCDITPENCGCREKWIAIKTSCGDSWNMRNRYFGINEVNKDFASIPRDVCWSFCITNRTHVF